ncbi:hypothetical protein [Photobacterium damselae]|uniref:hypothetical protein n=1 Tax=Photobacterium damselae TaxID=38293 RepID=UPI0010FE6FB4|nr:hypothetical protein [Photobacterium damselae]MCG3844160.1 hypothetical protein [Photobacterium damselae]MCG9777963.1 hypothetical protein [Photobacterium damselae]TLS76084.1 hypothetical protein FD721_14095 [Photobacterium damselae subsp. damselae]TLS86358.1 hypothetical protein FD720_11615 [Photobacterium damselae subsp. damselae]
MKIFVIFLLFVAILSGCKPQEEQRTVQSIQCHTNEYLLSMPKNLELYKHQMALYSQEGGDNPLKATKFITSCHNGSSVDLKHIAQNIAQEIMQNPAAGQVIYYKQEGDSAYLLLNAHKDGWAGVSASLAMVEPLITRNILLNSKIKQVHFAYAPNDVTNK